MHRIPFRVKHEFMKHLSFVFEVKDNFALRGKDAASTIIDVRNEEALRAKIASFVGSLSLGPIAVSMRIIELGEMRSHPIEGSSAPRYAICATKGKRKTLWWYQEKAKWEEFESDRFGSPAPSFASIGEESHIRENFLFISRDVAEGIARHLIENNDYDLKDIRVVTPSYYEQTCRLIFATTTESIEAPPAKDES